MAKSHLKLVSPTTVKRTVTPKRRPNADLRRREYLTEAEIERLLRATKGNRWSPRDATMILVAYRHGFRVSELVDLRWDQIDFDTATMAVRGAKRARLPRIPSEAVNPVPFARSSVTRSPNRPSCSLQNGARRSPPPALPAC
jgi:integrase